MAKKGDMKMEYSKSFLGYVLGIVSIVLAVFNPFPGLVLAIIGLSQSKKEKGALAKKAKVLNTWALVISIVLIILAVVLYTFGLNQLANFPTQ